MSTLCIKSYKFPDIIVVENVVPKKSMVENMVPNVNKSYAKAGCLPWEEVFESWFLSVLL